MRQSSFSALTASLCILNCCSVKNELYFFFQGRGDTVTANSKTPPCSGVPSEPPASHAAQGTLTLSYLVVGINQASGLRPTAATVCVHWIRYVNLTGVFSLYPFIHRDREHLLSALQSLPCLYSKPVWCAYNTNHNIIQSDKTIPKSTAAKLP